MDRRTVLSLAAVAAGTRAFPRLAAAQNDFRSGGIGQSIPEWEDEYGPGEVGQSLYTISFEGGRFNLGIDGPDDPVSYVKRIFDDPEGSPMDYAQGEAELVLPVDAERVEFFPGSSARIGYGSFIQRFECPSIEGMFEEETESFTTSIVVLVE